MRIKFLLATILNLTIALTLLTGCKKESSIDPSTSSPNSPLNSKSGVTPDIASGTPIWVIYNLQLVKVNIETVIGSPTNVSNLIYNLNNGTVELYKQVLNVLPNNGNGTYFRKVQCEFINPLEEPHQYYSESQILAAASGKDPIITLTPTNEFYKISISK